MKNIKYYFVAVILAVTFIINGCSDDAGRSKDSKNETKQRYLIAYSQAELVNAWRVTNQKDMEEWAKKLGVDFISRNANQSTTQQLADVKEMLTSKPDALIISPLESEALDPVVALCEKANVPLIVIDRKIDSEPGIGIYKTQITQSHVISGRLLAEKAVELLKNKYGAPKGNVVHIIGLPNASPVVEAKKGWEQIMINYPEIETIAVAEGRFTEKGGEAAMKGVLEKFPRGQIDIVHSDYSAMTMGALNAIKKAGRTELLGFVLGEGGHYKAIEAVINGEVARETQTPPHFGELAIKSALIILKGVDVSARQNVSIKVFDSDDKKSAAEYLQKIRSVGIEF
ncbi:MAG: substrate-binding domain-containing protein [Gammaproteobacteria bacterium]|nr:substrate-binding domain-containing protein [Gammaproteobacteria bacterium]